MVCYVVAAERNICQTCLLDMKYGLPVGVRDSLLSQADDKVSIPQSNVGQQYYYEQQALLIQDGQHVKSSNSIHLDLSNIVASRQLDRFSKVQQGGGSGAKTAFRNLPKLCSFWLNGTCSRVLQKTCPFRPCCGEDSFVFPEIAGSHRELCVKLVAALQVDGPAKVMKALDREIRDAIAQAQKGNRDDAIRRRVSGDDDLSKKYLGKMKSMSLQLEPPLDATILTLWLGNVEPDISEEDIRSVIYPYGQVSSIHLVRSAKCAFVEYLSREDAEFAASQLYNSLVVNGRPLTVNWARPRKQEALVPEESQSSRVVLPPPPGMESSHPTTYALPDLPEPTTTWSKPGVLHSKDILQHPSPSDAPTSAVTGMSAKRTRDSGSSSSVVASGGSALSYFSAYGEDDDDDDRPVAASEASLPKRPRTSAYPSMNPARIGSSLL